LIGCGSSQEVSTFKGAPGLDAPQSPVEKNTSRGESAGTDSEDLNSTDQDLQTKDSRKIIKTGTIGFETNDLEKTRKSILEAVKSNDGYISKDRQRRRDDRIQQTIVIRVPAANFDSLLSEILKFAGELETKYINARDVTEEFVDLQARLKTKKELEKRYLELLDRAGAVKDVLEIEREIGKLRETIESVEGRLKYLKDRVNFSSLTVNFYYRTASLEILSISKLKTAFITGWNNFLAVLIAALKLWPFIIIIGVIVYFIRRARIRRKKRKQQDNANSTPNSEV
jgi:hypothetical protein